MKEDSNSRLLLQMYYSEKGPYKRGSGGQTITFENSAVLVHAHMDASTYHPLLNISVIPQGQRRAASSTSFSTLLRCRFELSTEADFWPKYRNQTSFILETETGRVI